MPLATPTIDSAPPNPGVDLSARFEFSSVDSGVSFLGRLDADAFAPVTSPLFYSGPLPAGSHSFQVKATDGFTESSAASYTWRVPWSLSDAGDSWETRVAKAVARLVRADQWFSDVFRPILLIESPTQRQLLSYSGGTLAIFPGVPEQPGFPSDRIVPKAPVYLAAYLPFENGSEDSKMNASNVLGRMRKLFWSNQILSDTEPLTDATITFDWVSAAVPATGGVLVALYRVVYQSDLEPTSGDLI